MCVSVGHIDYGAVVEMAANAKVMEKPDMRSDIATVASMASCSLMLPGSMETMLGQRKVDTCENIRLKGIETSSYSQTVV